MTGVVTPRFQKSESLSYPNTPVNHHDVELREAIEKAFCILNTESEKIIKLLPRDIDITITFFEAIEDVWNKFIAENNLPSILVEYKDDFLGETLDNGAGARLFYRYRYCNK